MKGVWLGTKERRLMMEKGKYNGKGMERTLGYRKLNLLQLTTDGHFRFLNMVKEFHEGSSHLWLGISVEFGAGDSGPLY